MIDVADAEIDRLVETFDRFLAEHSPLCRLRQQIRETSTPSDRQLWRQATRLGFTTLGIPTAFGGGGCEAPVVGRALEACAAHLPPEPFLTTMALATPVLVRAESGLAGELLRAVAAGEAIVSVETPTTTAEELGRGLRCAPDGGGRWRLTGETGIVVDAGDADWVVVPASDERGLRWFALQRCATGPGVLGTTLDGHPAARVHLRGAVVNGDACLGGDALTETVRTTSATLVASWLMGISRQAFELTLQHLRDRRQFGAPIGSFQALQHRMAQLYSDMVVAEAMLEAALHLPANDASLPLYASAAKARLGELTLAVTRAAIHYHGGIGMTAEADVGLYYKAAWTANLLAGDHIFHRQRAADLMVH